MFYDLSHASHEKKTVAKKNEGIFVQKSPGNWNNTLTIIDAQKRERSRMRRLRSETLNSASLRLNPASKYWFLM